MEPNSATNGCLREDALKIEECDQNGGENRIEVSYEPEKDGKLVVADEKDLNKYRLYAVTASFTVVSLILILALMLNVTSEKKKTDCKDFSSATSLEDKRPHIVFILVDNLGSNEVGWNNSELKTPTLNSLASEGIILNNYYAQSSATASRAALLTGRYPYKLGFQQDYVNGVPRVGLPEDGTLLPRRLKQMGYSTHMIGKWDIGLCDVGDTPLYRGFDSFYGYYMNDISPLTHSYKDPVTGLEGINLYDNTGVVSYENNTFLFDLFEKRIAHLIATTNPQNSMFLLLSIDSMLSSQGIPDRFQDMHQAVDELIGNLRIHLESSGLLQQTVLVFSSSNGVDHKNPDDTKVPNDSPGSLSERQTQVPAFVYGKLLNKTGYVNTELIHVTDWMPTLVSIAGGPQSTHPFDGMDMSETLLGGKPSPRNEFIYNIELDNSGIAGIRQGDYKLVEKDFTSPEQKQVGNKGANDTTEYSMLNQNTTYNFDSSIKYLYNLSDDPSEETNLAASHPEKVKELHGKLVSRIDHVKEAISMATAEDLRNSYSSGVWVPGRC